MDSNQIPTQEGSVLGLVCFHYQYFLEPKSDLGWVPAFGITVLFWIIKANQTITRTTLGRFAIIRPSHIEKNVGK